MNGTQEVAEGFAQVATCYSDFVHGLIVAEIVKGAEFFGCVGYQLHDFGCAGKSRDENPTVKSAADFGDLEEVLADIIKASKDRPGLVRSALDLQTAIKKLKEQAQASAHTPDQVARRRVALLNNLKLVLLNAKRTPRISANGKTGDPVITQAMLSKHMRKRAYDQADDTQAVTGVPAEEAIYALNELSAIAGQSTVARDMQIKRIRKGAGVHGQVAINENETDEIVLVTPAVFKRYKMIWEFLFLKKTTYRGKRRNTRNLRTGAQNLITNGIKGLQAIDARKGRKRYDKTVDRRIIELLRVSPRISTRAIAEILKKQDGILLSHVSVAARIKAGNLRFILDGDFF